MNIFNNFRYINKKNNKKLKMIFNKRQLNSRLNKGINNFRSKMKKKNQ